MALPQVQVMTPEAFDVFAELPENAETLYEYIDGEIYEMPSNTHSSEVGITFAVALFNFVKPRKLGHVTGENGGYQIAGARIAPDVAFISSVRQKKLARRGYNPNPPELAVEVLSPTDRADQIAKKRAKYEEAGVYHIWIDPEAKTVELNPPGQTPRTLTSDDTIDGIDFLPGFTLAVRDLFADEGADE